MIDLAPIREAVDACTLAYGRGDADAWAARGWDVEPKRFGNTELVVLSRGNRLIAAFAGSNDDADWGDNLRAWPRRWRDYLAGRVHRGFARHYQRATAWLLDRIGAEIDRAGTALELEIYGHSLGAIAAELLALDVLHRLGHAPSRVVALAAPRGLGWRAAGAYARSALGGRTYRVVTVDELGVHDGVTRVMPRWAGYAHVGASIVLHPDRVAFGEVAWQQMRGLLPSVWPWQLLRVVRAIRRGKRAHGLDVYASNLEGLSDG